MSIADFASTISFVWGVTVGGVSGYVSADPLDRARDGAIGAAQGFVTAVDLPIGLGGALGGTLLSAGVGALTPEVAAGVSALLRYGKTGQLNQHNADQLAKAMGEDALEAGSTSTSPDLIHAILERGVNNVDEFVEFNTYNPPLVGSDFGSYSVINVYKVDIIKGSPVPTDNPFVANPDSTNIERQVSNASPVGGVASNTDLGIFKAGGEATINGNNGSFTLSSDGDFSYQANNLLALPTGFHPGDSFTYILNGSQEGILGTIDIVFNRAPIVVDATANVVSDRSVTADAAHGVLIGDFDSDGDTIMVSAVGTGTPGAVLAGAFGHLTLNADGSYFYAADNVSRLTTSPLHDIFEFTVSDGHDGKTVGHLDVTITAADQLLVVQGAALTSFDLVAHGFGRAVVQNTDTAGTQWWSSSSDYYNAAWQKTNTDTFAHDGRVVQTTFDTTPDGTGNWWQYISDYKESSGMMTAQDGLKDDGGTFSKAYNIVSGADGIGTDGVPDWLSSYTNFFRSVADQNAGHALNVEGIANDGRKFTQTNDIDGAYNWKSQTVWFNPDGTKNFIEVHYDDGSTLLV